MELKSEELLMVCGGLSVSGTLINSMVKGLNSFLEIGRSLGNAIRRLVYRKVCPL